MAGAVVMRVRRDMNEAYEVLKRACDKDGVYIDVRRPGTKGYHKIFKGKEKE